MKEIVCEHKILGYKSNVVPISITDEIMNIANYLYSLTNEFDNVILEYKDVNLKSEAKKFFKNNLISLHNVLVEKELETDMLIYDFDTNKIKNFRELYKRIMSASKLTSPYDIPIVYDQELESDFGYLNWRLYNFNSEEFLSKIKPIYQNIELSYGTTNYSSIAYIHELVHTQVDTNKDSINKYYNAEIASIFFEMVAALQKDKSGNLLRDVILIRYSELLSNIELLHVCQNKKKRFEEAITASMYIVSTLKANMLFDIYLESNTVTRSVIMNKMQLLFDGKITLESVLKDFDINKKNSSDINILKKHI